jgi:hypothetical protein
LVNSRGFFIYVLQKIQNKKIKSAFLLGIRLKPFDLVLLSGTVPLGFNGHVRFASGFYSTTLADKKLPVYLSLLWDLSLILMDIDFIENFSKDQTIRSVF